jgi:diguanylate cyclase (GGDEF)-like protein
VPEWSTKSMIFSLSADFAPPYTQPASFDSMRTYSISAPLLSFLKHMLVFALMVCCGLPLAAQIASPIELESGIAKYDKLSDKELAGQLAQAGSARGNDVIFLRFVRLRRASAAGDAKSVGIESERILAAAAALGDESTLRTVYSALGDSLSTAGGRSNESSSALRAEGRLIAAEKMRQRLEDLQHTQQLQLEYMTRRNQMQMRLTLLLMACLVMAVGLAWSLWRIANDRREQALEDPLTGLKNRRFVQAFMDLETQRLRRSGQSALILIADVDHFKQVNDRWGHEVGDKALIQLAVTLRSCMRNSDVVVRWGGEEFLIVCSQSREADAERICSRIQKRLLEMTVCADGENPLHLTISIGAALFSPAEDGLPWEAALERADQCLYHVKQHGRDNWCLAPAVSEATAS